MLMRMPGSYWSGIRSGAVTCKMGTYASVDTGDRDEGAGVAVATVRDVELRTADVELGAAVGAGDVESDL